MKTISVNIPTEYVKGLEELVKRDNYANRSEAIRVAVRDLLRNELWTVESQIPDKYEVIDKEIES